MFHRPQWMLAWDLEGNAGGGVGFRGTDCRPNVPKRDALYVNSSAIDLAEVIQERANR